MRLAVILHCLAMYNVYGATVRKLARGVNFAPFATRLLGQQAQQARRVTCQVLQVCGELPRLEAGDSAPECTSSLRREGLTCPPLPLQPGITYMHVPSVIRSHRQVALMCWLSFPDGWTASCSCLVDTRLVGFPT